MTATSTPPTPADTAAPSPAADPLGELSAAGVAVWLDDLSRDRIRSGNLTELVDTRHVVGITTNPSIFQKALSDGDAYDEQIRECALRGTAVGETLRMVTCTDVRDACDLLRPVFEATDGLDGRVSIEVDPRIAHDADRTLAEARALWWLVDRPNLYIKIPAVLGGLPAVPAALAEGISVNVTLIFSLERYRAVLDAFVDGLERRHAAGGDLHRVESVASFFISRVDVEIDRRLQAIADAAPDPHIADQARRLCGQAAIANARLAYAAQRPVFASDRWRPLAAAGARPQRPLWASTGVKNPDYDDTRYVVELVAAGTVNTMPAGTLEAVAGHGTIRGDTIHGSIDAARQVLTDLAAVGVDYDDVVATLETQGVATFQDSWTALVEATVGQLEAAGATVEDSGTTRPAGSGPAAASRG